MRPVIIITDSYPAANSGGISQTLYNLFDNWKEKLYVVTRKGDKLPGGPVLEATKLPFTFELFRNYGNRWLKRLNPALTKANFNRQQKLRSLPAEWPSPGDSWILVSTTEPIKLQLAWLMQHRFGYTLVPFFMDDWMDGCCLQWKGADIRQVVLQVLKAAPCWLMISRQLQEILVKRYGLEKRPCLVVHNPAPVAEVDRLPLTVNSQNSADIENSGRLSSVVCRQLIYAGSIWPMHFDALQAVAKAIQLLNKENAIGWELTIYTNSAAWQHNRKKLEGPGIKWGGFIPYADMQCKLQEGWLLLVTASFLPEHAAFTNSSVQTKLTDYMAAGKPVLMVGPASGASAQFVHEWDCGYSINTSRPEDIAAQLLAISGMTAQSERKANNGITAALGCFNKASVQKRLYHFLETHIYDTVLSTPAC